MMIEPDLAMVIGVVLACIAVPGILSSLSYGRAPAAPIVTVLFAGGLIYYAAVTKPGGYEMRDIPDAFINLIAQVLA